MHLAFTSRPTSDHEISMRLAFSAQKPARIARVSRARAIRCSFFDRRDAGPDLLASCGRPPIARARARSRARFALRVPVPALIVAMRGSTICPSKDARALLDENFEQGVTGD
jgi:hypothetical protein